MNAALVQELKQIVSSEVGERVEDALEAAKRDLAVLEGRQVAFQDGAKAAEALLGSVDKDVEEGLYDLSVAAHVQKYLVRASNALQNLSVQSSNFRIAQTGKVQGFAHTVELLKGMMDAAKAKAEALRAAEAAPPPSNPREREEGTRPPQTIKERRLAEEAAELAASAPAVTRGKRKSRVSHS